MLKVDVIFHLSVFGDTFMYGMAYPVIHLDK